MGSSSQREFQRYDVSHCFVLGGEISEYPQQLRMTTLGQGGCGFFSTEALPEIAPPREVACSIFSVNSEGYEESHILMGNVLYITPSNSTAGVSFYYGVKFFEEDRRKLKRLISKLERLAQKGELQRV
ncbi:MAG: hypothetical protein EA369_07600 [Bradymonadales bacterium]|nr:MAG: hypothetical protein EA369_07600 [Bradymonadales bacterium]